MTSILRPILLGLLLVHVASTTKAEVTPEWIRQNTQLVYVTDCTDEESGERGTCFLSQDASFIYMTFVQDNQPVFIRRMIRSEIGVTYEQIWPEYQPAGQPL